MITKLCFPLLAFLLLAGCGTNPNVQPVVTPVAPTSISTQQLDTPASTIPALQTPIRATPVSDSPAAGICDFYPGELVVFEIYPDMPSPRCARATPQQRLKIINQTEQELRIRIGNYDLSLPAGQEQAIEAELGAFLAPGVHQISTTAYQGGGGPELWLTTDP